MRIILPGIIFLLLSAGLSAQNVFDPFDPILRWNNTQPRGTATNPDPAKPGLQKWVSVATNGVSIGNGAWDATSFKAYYINVQGRGMAFRLKFPRSFRNPDSASKKYPVMLFFHGAGEAGCPSNGAIYNNEKQLVLGAINFKIHVDNGNYDGFLLYPQMVPADSTCWGTWGNSTAYYKVVAALIDSLSRHVRADADRVAVQGLSAGGNASYKMAEYFPRYVAALMPSASAGLKIPYANFIHIPLWFASGGKDTNPSPAQAQYTLNEFSRLGGDVRYSLYPEKGHAVWGDHWREPDYVPFMNRAHKANPLVFFQRSEICPDSLLQVRIGITQGFYAYEWQRNGVTVATSTNGVHNILNPSVITSTTGNEITVGDFGTYRVRFRRLATSDWSVFSPIPVTVTSKTVSKTAPISVDGLHSVVLPAPDGSTTVPLSLPDGFIKYEWYNANTNALVATGQHYTAGVGAYKAKTYEPYGCGSEFSPVFQVVNANGAPKPDAASNLTAVPGPQSGQVQVSWQDKALPTYNETGFELYRAVQPGGPYSFITLTGANQQSYLDSGLQDNQLYYYLLRPVNQTGAAAPTAEAPVKTRDDQQAPPAPRLFYQGSDLRSIEVAWNPSSDPSGILRYDIYLDGTRLYSSARNYFVLTGLDSLTSYQITVRAVDSMGNVSAPSNQLTAFTHRPGTGYKYYHGSWNTLPDFNTLTPLKSGATDTLRANPVFRTQTDNYALLYQAYIYIPEAATYTFETTSDAANKLYIGNYSHTAAAVVQNDTAHAARTRTGSVYLQRGYHPLAVSYLETTGSEILEINFWNNTGMARQRLRKNMMTPVAYSLPAVPAIPGTFSATALSAAEVRLSWLDNSSNESGFEIWRSLLSSTDFVPIATTGANATSFTDSGLKASTRYYYRLRAVGPSGESAYALANAQTQAASGSTAPAAPTRLQAQGLASIQVALSWNDNASNETAVQLWRSTSTNTAYSLLATLPANATAYTDQAVSALGRYYYYVVALNGSTASSRSNEVLAIPGNTAPVISQPADMLLEGGTSAQQNITISDNAGDQLQVSLLQAPAFVSITAVNATTYSIQASPATQDMGTYELKVIASDDKGNSTEKTFRINVSDKNTRAVYVKLGGSAPAPWNNWSGTLAPGSTRSDLRDEYNAATGFSITTTTGWPLAHTLGFRTGDNSGLYADTVLVSGVYQTDSVHQMVLRGLNPSMRYNLAFVSSRNEGSDASMEFIAGGKKVLFNARYNAHQSANLNGLAPAADGSLAITIRKTNSKSIVALNALVIEEYAPATPVMNPIHLVAETADRTTINLSWVDRSHNEDASGGFELQRAFDPNFTKGLVTLKYAANTTTAKAAGLYADTTYWFRIRAKAGSTYSEYSIPVMAKTPSSLVNINFNYTVPSAPTTWNNLVTMPTTPITISNLVNYARINTGMSISIDKVFNGEFNAGMITGNNSGIVPDNVMQANYWLDRSQVSTMRLSGLKHNRIYTVGFTGSSGPAGWYKGNYTATYTIGDKTVYLNSWENTSKMVYIKDVQPNENGEIIMDFSTTKEAAYGFNAAIILFDQSPSEKEDSVVAPPPVADPDNQPPVANAGYDQTITLPTNYVTLNSGWSKDPDGKIISYSWSKVSGIGGVIESPSGVSTKISSLQAGIYTFRITVKDDKGAIDYDDLVVTVKSGTDVNNQPPVANAGYDQTITLPTNYVTLNSGWSKDPDGKIISYTWSKVSGTGGVIESPNGVSTKISSLQAGLYTFRITVKDDKGAVDYDDLIVTVNSSTQTVNQPPVANAGYDQTITLPTNYVNLNSGWSKDPDGTIISYTWSKVSGSGGVIESPTGVSTRISSLQAGTYIFRITVKDDKGAVDYDDLVVTVKTSGTLAQSQQEDLTLLDQESTIRVEETINISPNPASGFINITLGGIDTGPTLINIYNLYGSVVKRISTNKVQGIFTEYVDISSLRPGTYMVEVIINNSKKLKSRFIKK